ncbi:NAD(P)H-dependent flavin oxidoreductase [Actinomycetospora soli]|uniref:NAD(P)H-dependent flavin oxidoreductase n=1 Tax=Actinomycetospora soli TaxID=2893887 RepID=UPI001E30125E|nr:nitronate monooxygenase [Actinomycetospora soli]MCD2186178.1 nitronate monooxygenase [Actinomycetospora soli]
MLTTRFTARLGVEHPVALAPMGGAAGGALAAAVSNGGGLGLLGVGSAKDPAWVERELDLVAQGTDRPWGAGFQCWAAPVRVLEQVLERGPAAIMLAFGDPRPYLDAVRRSDAALIVMVTDLAEAHTAVEVGADVIVAQGTDAGGHGGSRGTIGFVPVVADLAGDVPVLAAGGIADGRGVAAALALGADGALLGTRFLATPEALGGPVQEKAVLEGGSEDTDRSSVVDIAHESGWPARWTGRALRTPFSDRWRLHEDALRSDPAARAEFRAAEERGDPDATVVWAGESLDLVTDLVPAADLVGVIAGETEAAVRRSAGAVR